MRSWYPNPRPPLLPWNYNPSYDENSSRTARGSTTNQDHQLIGHILFSPVTLSGQPRSPAIAGLGPMAVLPEWQRRGIGSLLVTTGLAYCASADYVAVVVLGHPAYYPRFGFVPASGFKIKSEFNVPDEVFMVKELQNGALQDLMGTIQYHPAFKQA